MRSIALALLVIFFTACGTTVKIPRENVKPLLDTSDGVKMYDFHLSYGTNDVEGWLLINVDESGKQRFILTSSIGMSLFDLEGTHDAYRIHYVIDFLDRKRALDLLWNDFAFLFSPQSFKRTDFGIHENGNIRMFITGHGPLKTVITARDYKEGFPETILVDHPRLRLRMLIKKPENVEGSLLY
ncbi:MAG: hypothetical protein WC128_01800 [Bacteroidales bacterium]|jgi:hypothetical protein